MDKLDDEQGRRPRHNESTSDVRRCKVGPKCDVGDEGEGRHYSEPWKRHDYEWFVDNTSATATATATATVTATVNDDGAEGAL